MNPIPSLPPLHLDGVLRSLGAAALVALLVFFAVFAWHARRQARRSAGH